MSARRYSRSTTTHTGLAAIGIFALIIGLWLGIIALFAAVLSWAWNLVVPSTFGGPTLDFGAAFALLIVFMVIRTFLFGGRGSK